MERRGKDFSEYVEGMREVKDWLKRTEAPEEVKNCLRRASDFAAYYEGVVRLTQVLEGSAELSAEEVAKRFSKTAIEIIGGKGDVSPEAITEAAGLLGKPSEKGVDSLKAMQEKHGFSDDTAKDLRAILELSASKPSEVSGTLVASTPAS